MKYILGQSYVVFFGIL